MTITVRGSRKGKGTGIRLVVSNETDNEIRDVLGALATGCKFIYWGINIAWHADYLFVHRKGEKDILGVLKVFGKEPVKRELISALDFLQHRPAGWGTTLLGYQKFYRIVDAKEVHFPFEELVNRHGSPLEERWMHDMVFVDCRRFKRF